MAEAKTQPTAIPAAAFLAAVEPAARRAEALTLDALFREVTGEDPLMWGPSIVGYGAYRYRYASGHSGRAARLGFSPRKARHSLYLLGCGGDGADPRFEALLAQLGKHQRAVACLYVNKLADIDLEVLRAMVALSWRQSFVDWPDS